MFLIISYTLYLIITIVVTVWVGWLCYKNGIHYIKQELQDEALSQAVNKFLLIGYYLTNIGYAAIMIYNWDTITNVTELIRSLSNRLSLIVLSMGCMHYINIAVIYLLRQKNKNHTANTSSASVPASVSK